MTSTIIYKNMGDTEKQDFFWTLNILSFKPNKFVI